MILSRPAAIIFDMDGLLLDTERISRETMIEAMAILGFAMTEADFAPLIGTPEDISRGLMSERFGPGLDYDRMRAEQARIKAATWGDERPLMPGARALVEAVAALGILRGVATSSQRASADAHLGHMGLTPFMNVVVTRNDVARGKPAPDLYLAAVAALGAKPESCLALEDSHNGVRAAFAAGIPVIMVPDLLPATVEMHSMCAAVVPGLDTVRDWLLASSSA